LKTTLKRLALNHVPPGPMGTIKRWHYLRSLKHYDIASEPDLCGCQLLLCKGDNVIDVGANIGVYTRFCSDFIGSTGQVIALEPVPETFSYLQSNTRALGLRNVQCLNVAASDHDCDTECMRVPTLPTGGPNLYGATLCPDGNVSVKARKLDSLIPTLTPALIKCDVEGHEAACIAGARELIRRCRPKFLMEVTDPGLFTLFDSLGYKPFYFDQGQLRPRDPEIRRMNFFFIPQENAFLH